MQFGFQMINDDSLNLTCDKQFSFILPLTTAFSVRMTTHIFEVRIEKKKQYQQNNHCNVLSKTSHCKPGLKVPLYRTRTSYLSSDSLLN